MTTVIECVEGHYEVEETSYGHAYVWRPQRAVVECDCGEGFVAAVWAHRVRVAPTGAISASINVSES